MNTTENATENVETVESSEETPRGETPVAVSESLINGQQNESLETSPPENGKGKRKPWIHPISDQMVFLRDRIISELGKVKVSLGKGKGKMEMRGTLTKSDVRKVAEMVVESLTDSTVLKAGYTKGEAVTVPDRFSGSDWVKAIGTPVKVRVSYGSRKGTETDARFASYDKGKNLMSVILEDGSTVRARFLALAEGNGKTETPKG